MRLALADTAAMPLWLGEQEAPQGLYTWASYTELGPYVPAWSRPRAVPYAVRRDHEGRHNVRARWGSLRKWAKNACRELGDFMVGAFQPIREAI